MKAAATAVFPPQCPGCGAGVAEDGGLCPACWADTDFIAGLACATCGAPLPGGDGCAGDSRMAEGWAAERGTDGDGATGAAAGDSTGDWTSDAAGDREGAPVTGALCDDCLTVPRPWRQARAALVYAGTGRRLTLALKHGDRVDLAPLLGGWLARAAAPLVGPGTLVVPVPVHPRRLLRRKYNQAALLGAGVARAHRLPLVPGALVRLRHTPMQDHGSVADRFANVEGALAVPAAMQRRIKDRPLLIVDDVMASGATLAAATDALSQAGGGPVSVAVLARAVKDGAPAPRARPE